MLHFMVENRGWMLGASILGMIGACAPVAEKDVLGANEPPANIELDVSRIVNVNQAPPALAPKPEANEAPGIDSEWADTDIISARTDNMAFRADGAAERFNRYINQILENRGFALETETLSAAEANAGARSEWWDDGIYVQMKGQAQPIAMSLQDVVHRSLTDSNQIKAFGLLPAIRATAVREAHGRYTPEAFAEVQLRRQNDPASSPALTAGADRILAREGTAEFGVRGRIRTGAEYTIAQRFSAIDTNQTDFIPGKQANSRTTLTLVQPLLRGSGTTFNDSATRIAEIDTKISQYELVRQLENHILEVERAYWNLYVTRANLLLTRHLAEHGRRLSGQAYSRGDIDGDPTLSIRANAAYRKWESDVVRAEAGVKNAQFRLAALTDSPELRRTNLEFVTMTPPVAVSPQIAREDVIAEVTSRRPELQQAFLQYKAAVIREGAAANDDLPELDLVLEAALSGDEDGTDFGGALGDSQLGGFVGVRLSVPLGYDERAARYERRRLETIQQRHQSRSALSTVLLEVEISASEYAVAARDLEQQRRARKAAQRELSSLRVVWQDGSGGGVRATALSALIDAHERAALLEMSVAQSRATLAIAAANFNRSRGVLLDRWNVEIGPTPGVREDVNYRPYVVQ
ncbi:MAG: TolC family protein [Pikeienuella sp.]